MESFKRIYEKWINRTFDDTFDFEDVTIRDYLLALSVADREKYPTLMRSYVKEEKNECEKQLKSSQ